MRFTSRETLVTNGLIKSGKHRLSTSLVCIDCPCNFIGTSTDSELRKLDTTPTVASPAPSEQTVTDCVDKVQVMEGRPTESNVSKESIPSMVISRALQKERPESNTEPTGINNESTELNHPNNTVGCEGETNPKEGFHEMREEINKLTKSLNIVKSLATATTIKSKRKPKEEPTKPDPLSYDKSPTKFFDKRLVAKTWRGVHAVLGFDKVIQPPKKLEDNYFTIITSFPTYPKIVRAGTSAHGTVQIINRSTIPCTAISIFCQCILELETKKFKPKNYDEPLPRDSFVRKLLWSDHVIGWIDPKEKDELPPGRHLLHFCFDIPLLAKGSTKESHFLLFYKLMIAFTYLPVDKKKEYTRFFDLDLFAVQPMAAAHSSPGTGVCLSKEVTFILSPTNIIAAQIVLELPTSVMAICSRYLVKISIPRRMAQSSPHLKIYPKLVQHLQVVIGTETYSMNRDIHGVVQNKSPAPTIVGDTCEYVFFMAILDIMPTTITMPKEHEDPITVHYTAEVDVQVGSAERPSRFTTIIHPVVIIERLENQLTTLDPATVVTHGEGSRVDSNGAIYRRVKIDTQYLIPTHSKNTLKGTDEIESSINERILNKQLLIIPSIEIDVPSSKAKHKLARDSFYSASHTMAEDLKDHVDVISTSTSIYDALEERRKKEYRVIREQFPNDKFEPAPDTNENGNHGFEQESSSSDESETDDSEETSKAKPQSERLQSKREKMRLKQFFHNKAEKEKTEAANGNAETSASGGMPNLVITKIKMTNRWQCFSKMPRVSVMPICPETQNMDINHIDPAEFPGTHIRSRSRLYAKSSRESHQPAVGGARPKVPNPKSEQTKTSDVSNLSKSQLKKQRRAARKLQECAEQQDNELLNNSEAESDHSPSLDTPDASNLSKSQLKKQRRAARKLQEDEEQHDSELVGGESDQSSFLETADAPKLSKSQRKKQRRAARKLQEREEQQDELVVVVGESDHSSSRVTCDIKRIETDVKELQGVKLNLVEQNTASADDTANKLPKSVSDTQSTCSSKGKSKKKSVPDALLKTNNAIQPTIPIKDKENVKESMVVVNQPTSIWGTKLDKVTTPSAVLTCHQKETNQHMHNGAKVFYASPTAGHCIVDSEKCTHHENIKDSKSSLPEIDDCGIPLKVGLHAKGHDNHGSSEVNNSSHIILQDEPEECIPIIRDETANYVARNVHNAKKDRIVKHAPDDAILKDRMDLLQIKSTEHDIAHGQLVSASRIKDPIPTAYGSSYKENHDSKRHSENGDNDTGTLAVTSVDRVRVDIVDGNKPSSENGHNNKTMTTASVESTLTHLDAGGPVSFCTDKPDMGKTLPIISPLSANASFTETDSNTSMSELEKSNNQGTKQTTGIKVKRKRIADRFRENLMTPPNRNNLSQSGASRVNSPFNRSVGESPMAFSRADIKPNQKESPSEQGSGRPVKGGEKANKDNNFYAYFLTSSSVDTPNVFRNMQMKPRSKSIDKINNGGLYTSEIEDTKPETTSLTMKKMQKLLFEGETIYGKKSFDVERNRFKAEDIAHINGLKEHENYSDYNNSSHYVYDKIPPFENRAQSSINKNIRQSNERDSFLAKHNIKKETSFISFNKHVNSMSHGPAGKNGTDCYMSLKEDVMKKNRKQMKNPKTIYTFHNCLNDEVRSLEVPEVKRRDSNEYHKLRQNTSVRRRHDNSDSEMIFLDKSLSFDVELAHRSECRTQMCKCSNNLSQHNGFACPKQGNIWSTNVDAYGDPGAILANPMSNGKLRSHWLPKAKHENTALKNISSKNNVKKNQRKDHLANLRHRPIMSAKHKKSDDEYETLRNKIRWYTNMISTLESKLKYEGWSSEKYYHLGVLQKEVEELKFQMKQFERAHL